MARKQDGYFLTAAHYPAVHHLTGVGYHDKNERNGRALDIICHSAEEILRGNPNGARLLLQMGVYHIEAVRDGRKAQWYPTVEDIELYIETYSEQLRYYISQVKTA